MQSRPDAALVRRDPAVPGLGTLLDDEALAAALRHVFPMADIRSAMRFYIRYKPGISCLTAYTVNIGGAPVIISARTYSGAAHAKLHKVDQLTQVPGVLPAGYAVLDDLGILLSVFPHDRKLRVLTRLTEADSRHHLIRRTLRKCPAIWPTTPDNTFEPLRYKPERRYVAVLRTGASSRAVFKFYTESEYARALHNAGQFESREALHVPKLLGRSRRHHILAFEWLPGAVLSEQLADSHLEDDPIRRVGRALAALHAQTAVHLASRTRQCDIQTLQELAEGLGVLCPHLQVQAQQIARQLCAFLAQEPVAADAIHGDCYAKQVLLSGERVAIVDFDEAMRGDRRADLGLFIAHLERDVLRGTLPAERITLIRDRLLEGYVEATREPIPPYLDIYTAIGLFQLSHAPFRHCEPNWPERMEALLTRVASLLPSPPTPLSRGSVAVRDPFQVTSDPKMTVLGQALNAEVIQPEFERLLRRGHDSAYPHLQAIRVLRYKPQRRCLIAYDLEMEAHASTVEKQTVIGKIRARGLDDSTHQLHGALQCAGFDESSPDGVSVPAPVGVIPSLRMWLQRCVSGVPAIKRLVSPDGAAIAGRIAEAIHKLHQTALPTHRQHTMDDELRILRARSHFPGRHM
ncbi:aminoglycoside phosphotransferase family protein [Candidatus Entotheonella palauensis]|uniref:aminoglycoside phosphotransferase family protein n=1 Tax=Candidatus Entotheonella palauensis TaxID=93172 RepID=UPI0015C4B63B|nr:aminoglycoside phosphotransferase family protein [Candidatus Entotheonella palauensis]